MQLLPRTPLSNIGAIQVLMRYKLKADHRADECDDKEDAPKAHRIFKNQHAENCCSKRTDSGPNRIGSSDREIFRGQSQKGNADDESQDRSDRGPEAGESISKLEAHGPSDFKQSG